jgi:hypothetical protein
VKQLDCSARPDGGKPFIGAGKWQRCLLHKGQTLACTPPALANGFPLIRTVTGCQLVDNFDFTLDFHRHRTQLSIQSGFQQKPLPLRTPLSARFINRQLRQRHQVAVNISAAGNLMISSTRVRRCFVFQ